VVLFNPPPTATVPHHRHGMASLRENNTFRPTYSYESNPGRLKFTIDYHSFCSVPTNVNAFFLILEISAGVVPVTRAKTPGLS